MHTVKGWSIKGKNKEVLTTHKDILERWDEFYRELYNSNRTTFNYFDEDPIPHVLSSEIVHC